jgi:hypothetical protein
MIVTPDPESPNEAFFNARLTSSTNPILVSHANETEFCCNYRRNMIVLSVYHLYLRENRRKEECVAREDRGKCLRRHRPSPPRIGHCSFVWSLWVVLSVGMHLQT